MTEIVQRCQRGVGTSRTLRVRTVCRSTDSEVPILMAARSKAWVCGRWPSGIVGSNPAGACQSVSWESWVLSGTGLCVGLITRSEEFYRGPCVWGWLWVLDNVEALAH